MSTNNAKKKISDAELVGSYAKTYLSRRDVSETYVESVTQRIKALDKWRGKPVPLKDLSDDLVNEWLTALKDAKTYTPRTVRHYRSAVLTIWRAAFDERILDEPPRYVRKV